MAVESNDTKLEEKFKDSKKNAVDENGNIIELSEIKSIKRAKFTISPQNSFEEPKIIERDLEENDRICAQKCCSALCRWKIDIYGLFFKLVCDYMMSLL